MEGKEHCIYKFVFGKLKRVLEVDGGDGCTGLHRDVLLCAAKLYTQKWLKQEFLC